MLTDRWYRPWPVFSFNRILIHFLMKWRNGGKIVCRWYPKGQGFTAILFFFLDLFWRQRIKGRARCDCWVRALFAVHSGRGEDLWKQTIQICGKVRSCQIFTILHLLNFMFFIHNQVNASCFCQKYICITSFSRLCPLQVSECKTRYDNVCRNALVIDGSLLHVIAPLPKYVFSQMMK